MASGDEKPWKTQGERKAYFTGLGKQKAANAANNWSSHWQSTRPFMYPQPWPFPAYAYPPGQVYPYRTNYWQPWSSHPPTHPMAQSQSPGSNQGQGTSQAPISNQEQVIQEFHRHQYNSERLFQQQQHNFQQHQYNADQSFNRLQSFLTGQPVHQMPDHPPPHQHCPAPSPYVPSYSPPHQHCPAPSPYVPFYPPQNTQCYDVGQPLGGFGSTPNSQTSQTQASSNLFGPDSVRCEEVNDTSTSASSVLESSETPVSSVATIDKIPEPDRKRKSETEIVEAIKRIRVESTAEAEGPTDSNNGPTKADTEFDRPDEIKLVLAQAYPDPSADDASIDQHQDSSHPDSKSPAVVAVDHANSETTPEILSWDNSLIDQHQNLSHPDSQSQAAGAVDHALAETTPEIPSWDHAPVDQPQESSHPDSKSPTAVVVDNTDAETKRKNKARNQHIASHERRAAPEKRTFRMLLELESTLKVAQDVPMPRAKPKYDSCYHLALSDLEDGDVNVDSSEGSGYMSDSGVDEDEGSITLDNLAEYSDDEELDNDEVKPRSRDLTPSTTAGKASAKAKAQNLYVIIKREAEK